MYVVINTLSIYECEPDEVAQMYRKILRFCTDGEKLCVSPTRTVN